LLSAHHPNPDAVAGLLDYTVRGAADRAPECIAAVSAKIDGLNDSTRAQLKERLRPLIGKILSEDRFTPLGFSAQLLAARLALASIDVADVRRTFVASSEPVDTRIQALQALIAFRDPSLTEALGDVLPSAPPQFTARVLAALGQFDHVKLADVILAHYPKLAPELQPLAIDLVLQRESWTRKLLDAVLANRLPKSVLHANHLRKILESDDREAIWEVEKAFGKIREERNPDRERVVAEMLDFLRKNLGDPVAGRDVFKRFCAQCHTIYGDGGKVGPDLTSNGRGSFDQLVASVFDPSLVIGPGYQTVTVVTKDGRNLTGLVTEDSVQRVVLKLPGEGEEVVPRNNVRYTRVSRLSMMPEGIETLLEKKDLLDLFAFLSWDKLPADPAAKPIPGAPVKPR
jgi:putative heme-binding domain-containing protein